MTLANARSVNVWVLAIVATWRVALYVVFLIRYAGFRKLRLAVAGLLPLSLIVFVLTVLNLERAVFNIMAGIDPVTGTSADSAYAILVLLTFLSVWVTPVVGILYLVAIVSAHRGKPAKSPAA